MWQRVAWVAEEFAHHPNVVVIGAIDDVPVDYQNPEIWSKHVEIMRQALESVPHGPVDVVITGEDYGDELAHRFEAVHERVDRSLDGRSGSRCRHAMKSYWDDLADAAKIGLAKRVVVVGAESTGTTTLAFDLATAIGSTFVPEYGRVASLSKLAAVRSVSPNSEMEDVNWSSDDFTMIAFKQQSLIDRACLSSPIVVADTDALATSVWHDRYVGGSHGTALTLSQINPATLYFLTSPKGIPFHQDGFRDGEGIREEMTRSFETALGLQSVPYVALEGIRSERLETALSWMARSEFAFDFAPPLG